MNYTAHCGEFVKFAKNPNFFRNRISYIYKKCVILHNRAKTAYK